MYKVNGQTRIYVEVFYPGILVSESAIYEVQSRDPKAISKKYSNCFCFKFFDQMRSEVELDGKVQVVFGERRSESPTYYPGGKVFTVEDVRKLDGDYKILISNMTCNGYERVVRSRMGNFQPFNEGDEIL